MSATSGQAAFARCHRLRDGTAQLTKARQWNVEYLAEADSSVGLPKTLRHSRLKLARCLRMQAVIRPTSGISDEQSRNTSPVQSRRWSSCVKAWLVAGNIARQKARLEMILEFRTLNRSNRIIVPTSRRYGHSPGGSSRWNHRS
jgi:hypothetical protein